MVKKILILLFVGIIIGFGFFLLNMQSVRQEISEGAVTPTINPISQRFEETESGIYSGEVFVEVGSISPGDEVVLKKVNLLAPAWAVVFEDDKGARNKVLGVSTLLPKGENKDIKIKLQRRVVRGEILHVGLHSDDGDSVFEFPDGLDIPMMVRGSQPFDKSIEVGI